MKRPLILQVLYSGLGGHSAVANTLIEAGGPKDPWRHHLLFYGIEPVAPGYLDICARLDIPFDHIQTRQGRPWAAWPKLVRQVRSISPDAIILHSIKTIVPMRVGSAGRPLVAVEHQNNGLKSKREWIVSAIAQILADRVVTLSPAYREALRRGLGPLFSDTRTTMVPTGVDLRGVIVGSRTPSQGKHICIGMASRFTPTKAQQVLVEAIGRLVHTRPETDWRLTLAGDGPCLAATKKMVREAGLQDVVDLPGHLPSDELPRWFGGLDAYAQASDGETLSTALLQAMAAGIPIVASDVPGIGDLLGPPTSGALPLGRLVPARDADAFAEAIAGLADAPEAAADQARRAREYVVTRHSPEAMRAGYAEILEDLWRVRSST